MSTKILGVPTVVEYEDYVLADEVTPCGPVPTALDANGVYP
jgi:hypothetical protein